MSLNISTPYKKEGKFYSNLDGYNFDLTLTESFYTGFKNSLKNEDKFDYYDNNVIQLWDVCENDVKTNGHFQLIETSILSLLERNSEQWFNVESNVISECFEFTKSRLYIINICDFKDEDYINEGDVILNISPALVRINQSSFQIIYKINNAIILTGNNKRKSRIDFTRLIRQETPEIIQEPSRDISENINQNIAIENKEISETLQKEEQQSIDNEDKNNAINLEVENQVENQLENQEEHEQQILEDKNDNRNEIKEQMIRQIKHLHDYSLKFHHYAEELKKNYFLMFPEDLEENQD
jgi:hypothetical protein